jgi:hypothetical protein
MRPSGTTETLTYLADDAVFQLVRYLHTSSGTFTPTDTRMVRPKPLSVVYTNNQANARLLWVFSRSFSRAVDSKVLWYPPTYIQMSVNITTFTKNRKSQSLEDGSARQRTGVEVGPFLVG